jgi:hypothetical protein
MNYDLNSRIIQAHWSFDLEVESFEENASALYFLYFTMYT